MRAAVDIDGIQGVRQPQGPVTFVKEGGGGIVDWAQVGQDDAEVERNQTGGACLPEVSQELEDQRSILSMGKGDFLGPAAARAGAVRIKESDMENQGGSTKSFLAEASSSFVGQTQQDAVSISIVSQRRREDVRVAQGTAGTVLLVHFLAPEEAVPTFGNFFAFPDGSQRGQGGGTELADGGDAVEVETALHAGADARKIGQVQGIEGLW